MAAPAFLAPLLLGAVSAGIGAMAMKGSGGTPAAPPPPAPVIPAAPPSEPTTGKTAKTGMQQSFLSGAASAQMPGAAAGGLGPSLASTGQKTLLGA